MLQAVVVGNVWSTKRISGLPSGAFLEVEVTGSGERLVDDVPSLRVVPDELGPQPDRLRRRVQLVLLRHRAEAMSWLNPQRLPRS